VIAHRLSTIRAADQVLVLDDLSTGRIENIRHLMLHLVRRETGERGDWSTWRVTVNGEATMRSRSARYGLAAACIGGGQGIAMVIESV